MDTTNRFVVLQSDVANLLLRIESNLNRRHLSLENDLECNRSVCGRTVSSNLANVRGFQKHLSHMNSIHVQKASEEVPDAFGHGVVRKGELYLKYKQ